MKRYFYLFTILLFITETSKAQYVTIPDGAFRGWLNANGFSSCMNGNQLDTTCSVLLQTHSLDFISTGIHDYTGLEYFRNIDTLNFYGISSGTNFIKFRQELTYLRFTNCLGLSDFPDVFPDSLHYLGINVLCVQKPLSKLPPYLLELDIAEAGISSLPHLPATLQVLYVPANLLKTLPTLPASLTNLYCYDNKLTSLPALPDSLNDLNCAYNIDIHCLPPFKKLGGHISLEKTSITCLPNAIQHTGYMPQIDTLSICTTSCLEYPAGISEQVLAKGLALQLYPNPCSGQLTLSVGDEHSSQPESMIVYDLNGRTVHEQKFETQLDVTGLQAGMYILSVRDGLGEWRSRFIKAQD